MSDYLSVSTLTERVEELEGERDGYEVDCERCEGCAMVPACPDCGGTGRTERPAAWAADNDDDAAELAALASLLDDLRGNGGDHKWRGDWYPDTLIPDYKFEDYARELAEDCGLLEHCDKWPATCINWDKAAEELQQDYSSVEYDGTDYWYRS